MFFYDPDIFNITEARAFMGVCVYYRIWINYHAINAGPIYQLFKKNAEFVWGPARAEAMDELKRALTAPPALMPVDYKDEPLQLPTSSSEGGNRVIQGDPQKVISSATASLFSFLYHLLYKLLFSSLHHHLLLLNDLVTVFVDRDEWVQFWCLFFVGVARDIRTIPFVPEH